MICRSLRGVTAYGSSLMKTPVIPADMERLAPRTIASHKGDFGTALLIGGSRGMAGAIALSGMAALRSGAGKVRVAVPDVCLETVAQWEPSYMTLGLDCDERGFIQPSALDPIQELAGNATCVAIGPGMGTNADVSKLVDWLFRMLPQPMVVDADGLNALASTPGGLSPTTAPRVLTPHPGEFSRLCKACGLNADKAPEVQNANAIELAGRLKVVLVLKGHRTLITDGHTHYHNTTGNPGMATGGSGDVLTGVITALVCQGLAPLAAARLGVFAHGLAGDLAADEIGQVGLTARDLIQHLPAAWKLLASKE